jgi:hypothetical protein
MFCPLAVLIILYNQENVYNEIIFWQNSLNSKNLKKGIVMIGVANEVKKQKKKTRLLHQRKLKQNNFITQLLD